MEMGELYLWFLNINFNSPTPSLRKGSTTCADVTTNVLEIKKAFPNPSDIFPQYSDEMIVEF
jgi:hypothetical protein